MKTIFFFFKRVIVIKSKVSQPWLFIRIKTGAFKKVEPGLCHLQDSSLISLNLFATVEC